MTHQSINYLTNYKSNIELLILSPPLLLDHINAIVSTCFELNKRLRYRYRLQLSRMMDDLLSLDFNFLDDDLLSFPMDEFNPIDSKEIESILNELEQTTNEKLFNVNACGTFARGQIRPTIMVNNRNSLKTTRKAKSNIGTSLLARPPKKLKKDKNSLLRNSCTTNSLLIGNRTMNNVAICQATFTAYFYQDHNYCFNSTKLQSQQPIGQQTVDLNNNNESSKLDSLTIETKEIVDSNPVLRKKTNSLSNGSSTATLNLISPNLFNASNGQWDLAHDLDDYFNISFPNSEETDSTSSNHSETDDDENVLKFDLENELSKLANTSKSSDKAMMLNDLIKNDANESTTEQVTESVESVNDDKQLAGETKVRTSDERSDVRSISETKNVLIDDLNNYNINELNELNTDTENELNSLDDEEDDILIETDIFIDEMFGDFEEYDLIANKRSKSSKNSSNKKINRNVNNKTPKATVNTNRRKRRISNSYSVRSGSSCSCCSEDLSEEEQQHPKRNGTVTGKHHHQQQTKSNSNKVNRNRSTSN